MVVPFLRLRNHTSESHASARSPKKNSSQHSLHLRFLRRTTPGILKPEISTLRFYLVQLQLQASVLHLLLLLLNHRTIVHCNQLEILHIHRTLRRTEVSLATAIPRASGSVVTPQAVELIPARSPFLVRGPQVQLPRPRRTVLVDEVEVGLPVFDRKSGVSQSISLYS